MSLCLRLFWNVFFSMNQPARSFSISFLACFYLFFVNPVCTVIYIIASCSVCLVSKMWLLWEKQKYVWEFCKGMGMAHGQKISFGNEWPSFFQELNTTWNMQHISVWGTGGVILSAILHISVYLTPYYIHMVANYNWHTY